ncbi:MAG TPA: FeoB-associated Cys-rich membrane protein [Opitutus sp.]|nr:FeoB-associated Cys-rich membrane protein [Opitutus sp.]
MTPQTQTIVALIIVALAMTWLVVRALQKRKNPGCGSDCTALTPELKRLQSHLAKRK